MILLTKVEFDTFEELPYKTCTISWLSEKIINLSKSLSNAIAKPSWISHNSVSRIEQILTNPLNPRIHLLYLSRKIDLIVANLKFSFTGPSEFNWIQFPNMGGIETWACLLEAFTLWKEEYCLAQGLIIYPFGPCCSCIILI